VQSFQSIYETEHGWSPALEECQLTQAQLLFVTGDIECFELQKEQLRQQFPHAELVGASSSIAIHDDHLLQSGLAVCALEFNDSQTEVLACDDPESFVEQYSFWLKKLNNVKLVILLATEALRHQTDWLRDIAAKTGDSKILSGAIASEEGQHSQLFHQKHLPESGLIAIAFCGDSLHVSRGSFGGWDPFGPEYQVTKSSGNRLLELDGQPALSVYQQALGEKGVDVLLDAVRYPLSFKGEGNAFGYIRAVVDLDGQDGSIELAGPIEQDTFVRFCKSGVSHLLDGAAGAATQCAKDLEVEPDLCLIFSSVRRQLILKDRLGEEVEIVRDHLGEHPAFCGFYSFGTIAPLFQSNDYYLHNQTMTVLALTEKLDTEDSKE